MNEFEGECIIVTEEHCELWQDWREGGVGGESEVDDGDGDGDGDKLS